MAVAQQPLTAMPQFGLTSAFDGYSFLPFILDDGGPNDTPSQTDLNSFSRADNVVGKLGVAFTWDDLDSWTGSGQTGDACALFDTDSPANGFANYAVCVRITNSADGLQVFQLPSGQSPIIYSCGDKKTDRCSQAVAVVPLKTTFCEVTKTAEAFPGLGEDGQDVLAACAIDLSAIGNATKTNILNVCSFPSGSPNSNAFDCVVTPGAGFLRIVKKTTPDQSGQTFSFTLNPAATAGTTSFGVTDNAVGDETTALIAVNPANYSLTEVSIPSGWVLSAASCLRGTTVTGTKSGSAITGIGVTIGETTVCTFQNAIGTPGVSVTKTATPTSIPETGGDVTYDVVVTNTSVSVVTLSTLTDDKFGDLNGLGTCATGGTIAAGGTYACSFTKTLAASTATTTHKNIVTATVNNAGGSASSTDDATVTFTDVAPTVTVTKTANPTSVPETGGSVTYTVEVKNTSAEPVTLTTLSDDKFGALGGQGDCATGGSIAAGATYKCAFSQTIAGNAGTTHTNVATATVTDDDKTTASANDNAVVTFTDVKPNISVTKTVTPTSLSAVGTSTLNFTPDRTFTSSASVNPGQFQYASATCDDAGPNDQPLQVDLNCFNRADNVSGKMGVQWTWDDINSWTGSGQTGDGCALLDTDNDGNANIAVCARITNTPDGLQVTQVPNAGAADVYLCNDTKADRCAKQVTKVSNTLTTTCTISKVAEAFPGKGDDGADVQAACSIDLGMQGLTGITGIDLLNVCSFPSGEPNSNPFDCVVSVGSGFIQIVKVADPTTTQLFGFTLLAAATDGTSKYAVQGGVTSGLIPVAPGTNYSLTETLASGWQLSGVSCKIDNVTAGTPNVAQSKITAIAVKTGQTTVCTFSNAGVITGNVTYTITVNNLVLEAATLDALTDDKFGNLNGVGSCATGGTIAGNGSYSCQFTKTLTGAAGTTHTNVVTAVAKDNDGNSVTKTATATVSFVASP